MKLTIQRQAFFLVLGSLLFQIVIIFPALIIPFGLMDDYHYIQPDGMGFFKNFQIPLQISFGRPLSALVLGIYSGFVTSLDDLAKIRLFSAVFVGLSQGWLAIFLTRAGVRALPALAIAALALSGPGIASISMWAIAAPFVPGLLFSLLAAELVYRSTNQKRNAFPSLLLIVAGICLVLSLLFYPPLGLFFSVPLLAMIIFGQKTTSCEFRTELLKNTIIVYGLSLVVFYVAMRLVYFQVVNAAGSQYTFGITSNLLSRLGSFLVDVTPGAANILTWHHPVVPMAVLGVIAMGFCIAAFRSWRISSMPTFGMMVFASIVLTLMSAAHLIIAHDDVRAARVLASYQAALAVLFSWGLLKIVSLLFSSRRTIALWSGLTCMAALAAGWTATTNITTAALNGFIELRYLEANLKLMQNKNITNLVVTKVPMGASFIGTTRNNGFNWTTSDKVSTMIPAMVGYALKQIHDRKYYVKGAGFESMAKGRKPLTVTAISPSQDNIITVPFDISFSNRKIKIATVDMRNLLLPNGVANPVGDKTGTLILSSASANGVNHDISRALRVSSNPDNFWEGSGFPITVKIKYLYARKISSYSFQTRDKGNGRMPRSWTVLGLIDGQKWVQLDRRTNVRKWNRGETRLFALPIKGEYSQLRIVFTEGFDASVLRIYNIHFE